MLPIQKCTVKNTFIDIVSAEPEESLEWSLLCRDVKTCMARFSQSTPQLLPEELMESSSEGQTDVSEDDGTVVEQATFLSLEKPVGSHVHVNIPLDVMCTTEPSPSNIQKIPQVVVTGTSFDTEKGCTIIDLRVCLQGTNVIVPNRDGARATASPGIVVQAVDVTSISANKSPKRSAEESKPSKNAVCRHWRSKGWCKYQTTCRFLHPEHKQGVAKKGGAKIKADSPQSGRISKQKKGLEQTLA